MRVSCWVWGKCSCCNRCLRDCMDCIINYTYLMRTVFYSSGKVHKPMFSGFIMSELLTKYTYLSYVFKRFNRRSSDALSAGVASVRPGVFEMQPLPAL